MKIISIM